MLQTPIITLVILLAAALVGGMVAHHLRQPVILGYLIIGVAVGPHALGLVGDVAIIKTAATMGVALLMFTLGLEVSISQLRRIGKVGLWGGIIQIVTPGRRETDIQKGLPVTGKEQKLVEFSPNEEL